MRISEVRVVTCGPGLTPFAAVVEASRLVTETSSRSRKIAILAELLGAVDAEEVSPCVGFLSGLPRQGRVGVGYSVGVWKP